ncbi:type VI secretion system baseplate subunit TssE [Pseudomonas alliivorans]|uniref:type VI secretion system baseplate subunit TssE n=1 Tax=Pseudomonas TaxID=286 RepID=UPI001AE138B9|nr:type VI secretion system baseplate subunit TssE [Pseudomonas alliivorans]MBP0943291.1 type VI secretion system baseplate subunit TssE [Pseudomonas alliivorans]MEE4633602.1 type VI secretion system baseplate subunit TssE [Pseudomonas alliivorans]MEE4653823.1 type VI secretion system baseplate subunit TssE [Pseudomonas alliivorans]MEE4742110.1 type VI secretion system baseplate subunit TssE [Pseudomonas alliivorans]MEE4748188.1 type VI secretion system baseplate subunit TssE [Pseudomonas alli
MIRCTSLFERLAGVPEKRLCLNRETQLVTSVAVHLSRMLSTRAGSVQTLPDYGLPDLNDLRFSLNDVMRNSRKAIEDFICAYEPRLMNVRVVSESRDDDALELGFHIQAVVNIDGVNKEVLFQAVLNGRGRVDVKV